MFLGQASLSLSNVIRCKNSVYEKSPQFVVYRRAEPWLDDLLEKCHARRHDPHVVVFDIIFIRV